MSLHAIRKRRRDGEPTSRPSSSVVTASFQVGDAKYAAPSATPAMPVISGIITKPAIEDTTASEPPRPIDPQATPR
jgi:hypothetical protein